MTTDLFYIYVKDPNSDLSWRYVGVFASRATADEWWRAVSTCNSAALRESIRRITPQFYTHNSAARSRVTATLTDPNGAPQFLDRVFFTLLNDRDGRVLSTIPIDHSRDLISGQTFYIRSKTNANEYWFCSRNDSTMIPYGQVFVSSNPNQRTLFRISLTSREENGTVMIGGDEITIRDVVSGVLLSSDGREGGIVPGGNRPGAELTFRLGDLLGFKYRGDRFRGKIVGTEEAQGEAWELV